jgi:hypothetical protein
VDALITPFRQRYERSCALEVEAQLEECADYLQNPEVLIAEFLESYYWVEGKLDPDRHDAMFEASQEELVLEPYFDSLVLHVDAGDRSESIRCLAGAFDPLPGELHPALEQKGVDYVGVREGTRRIVLGVTDLQRETTGFCLAAARAQLPRGARAAVPGDAAAPPRAARARRPEAAFDLQIGMAARERAKREIALLELTRDLAEMFKRRIGEKAQFEGSIGRIEALEIGGATARAGSGALRVHWRA